jgi:formylglycine-generating enzyme required for sulfatase activity
MKIEKRFFVSTLLIISALYLTLAVLLSGCQDLFGNFNNPADPAGEEYQGYETVEGVDNIESLLPEEGAEIVFSRLMCTPVEGVSNYYFQVSTAEDFTAENLVIEEESLSNHIFEISTGVLKIGVTYYWRVRGKAGDTWGSWTESRSFVGSGISADSVSPEIGGVIQDTSPLLSWGEMQDAEGYEIQIANNESGLQDSPAISSDTAEYQVQGANVFNYSETMYWRVRPIGADGKIGFWSEVFYHSYEWDYSISGRNPADSGTTIDTTPLLEWDDITGVATYEVEVNTASDFTGTEVEDETGLSLSQHGVVPVLDNNATYYWRVRAVNEDGKAGTWSTGTSFTVDIGEPTGQDPVSEEIIFDTTPLLDWIDLSEAISYEVQIADSILELESATVLNAGTTSEYEVPTDSAFNYGDIKYWRVRGTNTDSVIGDWSSPSIFTVRIDSGIIIDTDLDDPVDITFSGTLNTLYIGNNMTVSASVSAVVDSYTWYLNNVLQAEDSSEITITGGDLAEGVYTLTLVVKSSAGYSSKYVTFYVTPPYLADYGFGLTQVIAVGWIDTFDMGSAFGDPDEFPVHAVSLTRTYDMSTYEITNKQAAVVFNEALSNGWVTASTSTLTNESGDSQELLDLYSVYSEISYSGGNLVVASGKENHPVLEITWYGAVAFCYYLNILDGKEQTYDLADWSCDFTKGGYRLPTEAEWEYAARGGALSEGYTYSGSDTIGDVAWYSGNIGGSTHPVGEKQANELGLYDMSGNLWEWCNDWHDSAYYSVSPVSDPTGAGSGTTRVRRGGGWSYDASYCRVANRGNSSPGYSYYVVGFRPVLARSH